MPFSPVLDVLDWPNPITARAITDSGWLPSRRIDITTWVERLEAEGYNVSPSAVAILQNFGDLALHPPAIPEALWPASPLFFDPIDVGHGMYERYIDLESAIGHRMTPLAADSAGTTFVLILDDGRVVSDSVQGLYLLADTFPDALDLLLRRHRTPDLLLAYDRDRRTPVSSARTLPCPQ
ncbi:SUKH-3 domain-containing protein [Nocardia sp. NPDC088792]|uniref:SUKH-3 domain-containing protein n=1 Tax=Nocardia sp. NPDC088792 TaxID=3364332 RepID=UPI003823D10B